MYAVEARKKFWETLRQVVEEKGSPFCLTENKQWAIINKKTANYHEPCVAVDFLWRYEFLRINVYIENNKTLYEKLKSRKEEIETALGFRCLWKENDIFTNNRDKFNGENTRRIEIDIDFNSETLDFRKLAEEAVPIIEKYVDVFRGYIDC